MFRTGRLEALISGEWYGEKKGRLKPCVEALEEEREGVVAVGGLEPPPFLED